MEKFYLPYLINYSQPVVEDIIIFCVAFLTAIVVSAEGQAIVATLLGDSRKGATDRFHFNVFMHMSFLGTVNFFIAGFGWAREIDVDTTKFKKFPRFSLVMSRISGPLANMLLANIAASLAWILVRWGFEDKVFSTIVVVNVSMAVYGLLPVAPLPGVAFLWAIFPSGDIFDKFKKGFSLIGPYSIVGAFLLIRLTGWEGLSSILNPVVLFLSHFILGF